MIIEYLSLTGYNFSFLPKSLDMKLKFSNILFLGYSLRDWNMRAILHRIWREQKLTGNNYQSWAIQLNPDILDKRSWAKRDIEIIDKFLNQYIDDLRLKLEQSKSGEA
jgi:SIR2-like domain